MTQEININEHTALLDKVELRNIRVLAIKDMCALVKDSRLTINTHPIKYITEQGDEFSSISIKTDSFELYAGVKPIGNKRNEYCILSISVKDANNTNLCCYTISDYHKRISWIKDRLFYDYGIAIDTTQAKLRTIEINRTFKLEHEFESYHRVFTLIMGSLSKRYQNQMEYLQNLGYRDKESFYATSGKAKSQRCLILKIYNKSKSVQSKITLTSDYARFEITILGMDKIKTDLGTNIFNDLTDTIINNYFDHQMQKLVITPIADWQKARDKHIKQIINQFRDIDKDKYWAVNTLRLLADESNIYNKPTILDVEELINVINTLKIPRQTKYDIKRKLRTDARRLERSLSNRDDLRLAEILDKIQ